MSAETTITCDGPGCGRFVTEPTLADAMRAAREVGWRVGTSLAAEVVDYCAECDQAAREEWASEPFECARYESDLLTLCEPTC